MIRHLLFRLSPRLFGHSIIIPFYEPAPNFRNGTSKLSSKNINEDVRNFVTHHRGYHKCLYKGARANMRKLRLDYQFEHLFSFPHKSSALAFKLTFL